jgi:hypothetical protein
VSLDINSYLDQIASKAMTLGLFDRVNTHEPKNAPGNGLTCAIWVQSIAPIQAGGLDSTSGRLEFTVRIYSNMMQDPQDAIDPELVVAVDELLSLYSGNFTLDQADIREVDLLGTYGTALSVRAGYLNADGRIFRVMDVTLPIIVNDIWDQVE